MPAAGGDLAKDLALVVGAVRVGQLEQLRQAKNQGDRGIELVAGDFDEGRFELPARASSSLARNSCTLAVWSWAINLFRSASSSYCSAA